MIKVYSFSTPCIKGGVCKTAIAAFVARGLWEYHKQNVAVIDGDIKNFNLGPRITGSYDTFNGKKGLDRFILENVSFFVINKNKYQQFQSLILCKNHRPLCFCLLRLSESNLLTYVLLITDIPKS